MRHPLVFRSLIVAFSVGLIALVGLLQPKAAKKETASPNAGSTQQRMLSQGDPTRGPQLVEMPPDRLFGAKQPQRELTVGYQWSQDVQGNPHLMAMAIKEFAEFLETALEHINEKIQVRIANVDLYPEVPIGIFVDGYFLSNFNPNEMSPSAAKHIVQSLIEHINGTLAPTPRERQQMKNSKKG